MLPSNFLKTLYAAFKQVTSAAKVLECLLTCVELGESPRLSSSKIGTLGDKRQAEFIHLLDGLVDCEKGDGAHKSNMAKSGSFDSLAAVRALAAYGSPFS